MVRDTLGGGMRPREISFLPGSLVKNVVHKTTEKTVEETMISISEHMFGSQLSHTLVHQVN